jgi:hypothetical protein
LKIKYWKIITTTAAQIWQNNGGDKKSCGRLLAQMRNYELRRDPYDQEFDRQLETPMSWWLSIKDKHNYLCDLAIMMFSITPHSAGCERIFSTLGWLFGKRRQRLGLSRVEAMAKIRSFCVSNIRTELAYVSQKHTEDKICEMINDSTFLQFEEVDEQINNETTPEVLEIPNHEVRVLIIEELIDLKKVVRELDDENSDASSSNSEIDSSGSDSNDHSDDNDYNEMETDGYDIDELTNQYLLDNEGDTL